MHLVPQAVIAPGGGKADTVAIQCDTCGIRRLEPRSQVEQELGNIDATGCREWLPSEPTQAVRELLADPPGTATYSRFKQASGGIETRFLVREDASRVARLPRHSRIDIRSALFERSGVGLFAVLFNVEGEIYETWWNWCSPLHRACFQDMINQLEVTISFFVDETEPARTIRATNAVRDTFRTVVDRLAKIPPWEMSDFDRAREKLYDQYPDIQALWSVLPKPVQSSAIATSKEHASAHPSAPPVSREALFQPGQQNRRLNNAAIGLFGGAAALFVAAAVIRNLGGTTESSVAAAPSSALPAAVPSLSLSLRSSTARGEWTIEVSRVSFPKKLAVDGEYRDPPNDGKFAVVELVASAESLIMNTEDIFLSSESNQKSPFIGISEAVAAGKHASFLSTDVVVSNDGELLRGSNGPAFGVGKKSKIPYIKVTSRNVNLLLAFAISKQEGDALVLHFGELELKVPTGRAEP